jgi:type II secretory pathway pseudopilin PulG
VEGRRFCIPPSTVHRLQSTSHAGFTLLEVLVSMSILMMIVLMMATLFGQSTTAWDQGINQAKLGLKGRAVMRMMQNDLSQAVADEMLPCSFSDSSFEVYVLTDAEADMRTLKGVKYWMGGSGLERGEVEFDIDNPPPYGQLPGVSTGPTLLKSEEVDKFRVTRPPGGPYTTNLPAWVELELVLKETMGQTAGIKVWSGGRDGSASTNDNINTW